MANKKGVITEQYLTDIADAIREQNGEETLYTPPEMADAIKALDTSSGSTTVIYSGSPEVKEITFYDYDGTVIYSYTYDEFAALDSDSYPVPLEHDGLVSQGWNFDLDEIQEQIADGTIYPKDIAPMYITDDGKTRFYVTIPYDEFELQIRLLISMGSTYMTSVDWGDGTMTYYNYDPNNPGDECENIALHEYKKTGDYVISISGNNNVRVEGTGLVADNVICPGRYSLLKKAEIGRNFTIGYHAFYYCTELETITIAADTKVDGEYAINFCEKLKFLGFVSNNVESIIPDFLLNNDYSLIACSIPNSVSQIGAFAFNNCTSLKRLSTTATSIATYSFCNCYSLTEVYAPNATTFGDDCFYNCYLLSSLNVSGVITDIDSFAFGNCRSLSLELTLDDNIATISAGLCQGCCQLKSVTLPRNLTHISSYSFSSCELLTVIDIPEGVTGIGDYALRYCYRLKDYYLRPTTPPTLSSITVFSGIPDDSVIHVPADSYDDYVAAYIWSTYADHIVGDL